MIKSDDRIAIIALTKNGVKIANTLKESLGGDIFLSERLFGVLGRNGIDREGYCYIQPPFVNFIHSIFSEYDNFIFITATGIAVRSIAKVIKDKRTDPAVVVVDEQGKFAISLLSGHLGGANELTSKIAKILNSTPVITTASDGKGFTGIDVLAKKLGLYIENFSDLKKVSSLLVEKEKVAVILESGLGWEELFEKIGSSLVFCEVLPEDVKAAIYITDKNIVEPRIPYVILRPKNTVLGIGARRGVCKDVLFSLVREALKELDLSKNSVRGIYSIDIKSDEKCIHQLAKYLKVPLGFYMKDELLKVEEYFPISPFVKKTVGVGAVARPSAYLASDGGEELGYYRNNGITLAIYKRRTIWAG